MLHQNELLGEGKIKEVRAFLSVLLMITVVPNALLRIRCVQSIGALLKSLSVARENFGSISVQFGQPIDIKQYVAQYATQKHSGIVRDLAYDITDSMIACAACMPSHLVATVLLNYRNGISKSVLVQQTNLLRLEILKRGGRVVGSQGRTPTAIVDHALELLKDLVVRRRKDLVEPAITSVSAVLCLFTCGSCAFVLTSLLPQCLQREQYQNMIGLGYYRNKILHWFNREGVVACAFHALEGFNPAANDQSGKGVDRKELLQGALFLHDLLRMEFVRKDCSQDRQQLEDAVDHLLAERVLRAAGDGQRLAVSSGGQSFFSMLRTLFWPFVDSYWVAITSLFALRPGLEISMDDLLKRIQWLAETVRVPCGEPSELTCELILCCACADVPRESHQLLRVVLARDDHERAVHAGAMAGHRARVGTAIAQALIVPNGKAASAQCAHAASTDCSLVSRSACFRPSSERTSWSDWHFA